MANPDQNKATVRAYADAFSRGDFDGIRAHFTPDAVIQGVLGQGEIAWAIDIWRDLHAAYGLHLAIEDMAAEGDRVAVRFTETGTFRAAFRGEAPTGKSYRITAMEWFRMKDGLIAERWGARDSAAVNRQLAAD